MNTKTTLLAIIGIAAVLAVAATITAIPMSVQRAFAFGDSGGIRGIAGQDNGGIHY